MDTLLPSVALHSQSRKILHFSTPIYPNVPQVGHHLPSAAFTGSAKHGSPVFANETSICMIL